MEGAQPPLTAGEHPRTALPGCLSRLILGETFHGATACPVQPSLAQQGQDQACSPSPLSLSPGLMKKS